MPRYCITHGIYELEWTGNCLLVECPPPSYTSDEWVESLVLPAEEELILMDMNAEVLESDFNTSPELEMASCEKTALSLMEWLEKYGL